MARKLQNPLANIKAIMTDNTIGFNTANDEGTSYGFQLQPVYAVDLPDLGFTFLTRAVIPIMGLEPGTKTRITSDDGNPTPSGTSSVWGLGDTMMQFFFAPHLKSAWKWGLGPQLSVPTRTRSAGEPTGFSGSASAGSSLSEENELTMCMSAFPRGLPGWKQGIA